MSRIPDRLDAYSVSAVSSVEKALFLVWDALENFHQDLVLVGGLAVHYHTKDKINPIYRGTNTLDVDLGISLGADAGMATTVEFALMMQGFKSTDNGRMVKVIEGANLYIDFLTEHPPAESGTRNVSDVIASVCPGINRALVNRKEIEIQGKDQFGEKKLYIVPLCGIGPLLVLKLNAFKNRPSNKRAKDAYDILVAVSSYSEGAQAAVNAFHREAENGNPAYESARFLLEKHFSDIDQDGPKLALKFAYGDVEVDDNGLRLKEDLVTIALALLG